MGNDYIKLAAHYNDLIWIHFPMGLSIQLDEEVEQVDLPRIAIEYLKMALSAKAGVVEKEEDVAQLYLALAALYSFVEPNDIDRIISCYIEAGYWDWAASVAVRSGLYEIALLLNYHDDKSAGERIDSPGALDRSLEFAKTFAESGPYVWAYDLYIRALTYVGLEAGVDEEFSKHYGLGRAALGMAALYEKFGMGSEAAFFYRCGLDGLLAALDCQTTSLVDVLLAEHLSAAYLGLARGASQRGDHREAERLHTRALTVADSSGELQPYLLYKVRQVIADSLLQRGLVQQAITIHQDNIVSMRKLYQNHHPDIAVGYYRLGQALNRNGELNYALEAYIDAMERMLHFSMASSPEAISLHSDLGRLYGDMGKPLSAAFFFSRALRIGEKISERQFQREDKVFNKKFSAGLQKSLAIIKKELEEILSDGKINTDYQNMVCGIHTLPDSKTSRELRQYQEIEQLLSGLKQLGWRLRQFRVQRWQRKHGLFVEEREALGIEQEKEKRRELRLQLRELGQ